MAAFGFALMVVATLVKKALPFPDVTNMGSKFRHFAAKRNEFDVIFVGSSQFFHQIVPRQFDREVGAKGDRESRSFNFGVPGMWPPESFHLLRDVLDLHPAHLRWVVIELMDIDTRVSEASGATHRMVLWHDWRHTAMVRDRIAEQPGDFWKRHGDAGAHLALWARRFVNHGQGSEFIIGKMRKNNFGRLKNNDWVKESGYFPGKSTSLAGQPMDDYLAQLAKLKAGPPPPPMSPALARAVRGIAAAVRAARATPIFVQCPTVDPRMRFSESAGDPEIWSLNDPARFPELFDPAVRYDAIHLTPNGAVLFTHFLAERFTERLAARP